MTTLKIIARPRIKFTITPRPGMVFTLTEKGVALGAPGLSAYEVWLKQPGNAGKTVEEYFEAIRGKEGPQGPPGGNGGMTVFTGPKSSAIDAGEFGWVSLTDDYAYWCVKTGEAGFAIWKKTVMFAT
jgi:hypothetical protein